MYTALVSLGMMVLFVIPRAAELSVWGDELGWGQTILTKFGGGGPSTWRR